MWIFHILQKILLSLLTEFLLGTLKHLEISHTQIQNVDEETFQGLRLESLKLVSNKLLEFSEKSFRWVGVYFDLISTEEELYLLMKFQVDVVHRHDEQRGKL